MLIALTNETYTRIKLPVSTNGGICRMAHLPQGSIGGNNQEVSFQISYDRAVAIVRAANGSSYRAIVSWWCVPAAQTISNACV